MSDCLFCRIAAGEIKSECLYENEDVFVFKDIQPVAPVHLLVIPKRHFSSIKEVDSEQLTGKLFSAAVKVAEQLNIDDYRLVINTGESAGQTVFHVHLHLIGGRVMEWPPG